MRLLRLLVPLLCALLAACAAIAEHDDPVRVSMEFSTDVFTAPAEIGVTIRVSNDGSADLPGPVTLYDPAGRQVADFGEYMMSANETYIWHGRWFVTGQQLEKGKVSFTLVYEIPDDSGRPVLKRKTFSRRIRVIPEETPPSAPPGEEEAVGEVPDEADRLLVITLSNEGSGEWRFLEADELGIVTVSLEVFGTDEPDPEPWEVPGERIYDFRLVGQECGDDVLFLVLWRDEMPVRFLRLEVSVSEDLVPAVTGIELHHGGDLLLD